MNDLLQPKIAIVHDALCTSGGAERFAVELLAAFPNADFFTSVYLPDHTFPEFKQRRVRVLPLAKLIRTEKQFKLLYFLWLFELRQLDFRGYDLVLTNSTYLAKFINSKKVNLHKSFIQAPFRLLWKPDSYSNESLPTPHYLSPLIKKSVLYLQSWDVEQTKKIESISANSQNMAGEISRIYQRNSRVIYPPINIKKYRYNPLQGNFYLTVSRLISHKRIDLAIQACNRLGRKLVVVGDGPERPNLEKIAGPTVEFKGRVSEVKLIELYQNSRALIFPGEEDFGIVPLEAQACGKPVLAFGKGGLLETVVPGETGLFFNEQTENSLIECIELFETKTFSAENIRQQINKFDVSIFREKVRDFAFPDKR